MENLFKYATKELSQDAFLRWFFENYKDEQLGPIVVDFINYFSQNQYGERKQFNLKNNDIANLKTFSQFNDIDIRVDFLSNKFNGYRSIVIEDKTYSEEHNQLEKYNNAIESWKYNDSMTPSKCVYKIFYKTHAISVEEFKRVETAKWTPFDIKKIYNFFIKYLYRTDSDILNDYINHIKEIYECYNVISPKPVKEWNSINWETFFNQFMDNYQGIEHNFTSYRGIYNSMLIYLYFNKNKFLKYVAFEIQIRSDLKPYLHPGFHVGDRWEWSASAFEGEQVFEICKQELEDLRSFVDSYNSLIIKRANTARAFGKICESINVEIGHEKISEKLKEWVSELINIVKDYDKKQK